MKRLTYTALALGLVLSACSKHQDEPIIPTPNSEVVAPQPEKDNVANPKADTPKAQDDKEQNPPVSGDKQGDKPKEEVPPQGNQGKEAEPQKPSAPVKDEQKDKPVVPPSANRPADIDLGLRGIAHWRIQPEVYLEKFDFEALYIDNNTARFTAEYLKQFVRFEAVAINGQGLPYTFTEEDLKKVKIHDIKFDGSATRSGKITFYTSYNGTKSKNLTELPFDHKAYYDRKLKLDAQALGKVYLMGVSKHVDLFYNNLLSYDRSKYRVQLAAAETYAELSNNRLTCMLRVEDVKTNKELAQIQKTYTGFKSLSQLKSELQIASSHELLEYVSKRMKQYKSEQMRFGALRTTIKAWQKHLQLAVKSADRPWAQLNWETVTNAYGQQVEALVAGNNLRELDLCFEEPYFQLKSIRVSGEDVYLTLNLIQVNGQTVDIEQEIIVKGAAKQ